MVHPDWKRLLPVLLLVGFLSVGVAAQDGVWQGKKDQPMLRAALQDKDKNAKDHAAVVEVETQNIGLVDLGGNAYGGSDIGVLEYRVDQSPALVTEDTRVMFRDLSSGKHTIAVSLLNPHYKELGPKVELDVEVP